MNAARRFARGLAIASLAAASACGGLIAAAHDDGDAAIDATSSDDSASFPDDSAIPEDAAIDAAIEADAPPRTRCDDPQDANFGESATCNAVILESPKVQLEQIAEAPPAFAGADSIPDGDYFLARWILYTGDGGETGPVEDASASEHVVVSGNSVQIAVAKNAFGATLRGDYSATVGGGVWTWTNTCTFVGATAVLPFEVKGQTLRVQFFANHPEVVDELVPCSAQ